MKKFSFVILNYHTSEDTINCIESIIDVREEGFDISVVIVDNGSTYSEVQHLKDYINTVNTISCVLLEMHENLGFSKANNIGYKYAKDNYESDFIAISNSDIIIEQQNFFSTVYQLYDIENFSVLGPDIYVPRKRLHQSPVLGRQVNNKLYVKREIEKCKSKIETLEKLKKRGISKAVIDGRSTIWAKNHIKNMISTILCKGYKKQYEGEYIHGAFIVCSELFINKYDKCFEPEVFLYGEEDLLLYKCLNNKDKIMYSPRIQVLHYSGGTGKKKSEADVDKQLNYWKNELNSKIVLIEQFD